MKRINVLFKDSLSFPSLVTSQIVKTGNILISTSFTKSPREIFNFVVCFFLFLFP